MKRKDRFSCILEMIYGAHPNIVRAEAYYTGMCVTESGELARTYDLYVQPKSEVGFINVVDFKIPRSDTPPIDI